MVWRELSRSVVIVPGGGGGGGGGTPSAVRTMVGSFGLATPLWGFSGADPNSVTPDTAFTDARGHVWVETGGWIDQLRAVGACVVFNPIGGNASQKAADGSFSPTLWKARWDLFVADVRSVAGGEAKMRAAVGDGTIRAVWVLDDFVTGVGDDSLTKNAFRFAVTFAEIEDISGHAKADWGWMPLIARGPTTSLKSRWTEKGGGAKYTKLDAGWAQSRPRLDGDPTTFWAAQVQAGLDVDLGCIGGINLDQGSGTDPAWGCHENSRNGAFVLCGVSPQELEDFGLAALANAGVAGWIVWSYGQRTAYWNLPEIQTKQGIIYNASVGRTDASINVRGDLVPP